MTRTLEQVVSKRARPRPTDRAWAAGLFEGEGTATMAGLRSGFRPTITLANTDREIVAFFQRRWPGRMAVVANKLPEKRRDAWVWAISSADSIACFIADVLPFVKTTRNIERLTILREATFRRRSNGGRRWGVRPLELRQHLETAFARLTMLNRKGPRP